MIDLLATPDRRRLLFAALYLSEGAPIGFIWWALPTRLRAADVPIQEITWLTAVLVLPWTFKFLWAPLVDVLRSESWGRKQWIISAQIAMGAALVPLFWLDFHTDFSWLVACLTVHAFSAATQDVAIDALCISVTHPAERGRINGWMQSGMLLGRSVMGGGALIMASQVHENMVIGLLIGITCFSMFLVVPAREQVDAPRSGARMVHARKFLRNLGRALAGRNTWLGILFASTGAAAAEGVGVVAGPYLVDRGFTQDQVGWFFLLPVLLMIPGSLVGGMVADRFGPRRAVVFSQGVIVASIVVLAAADFISNGNPGYSAMVLLAGVYYGTGLLTASSYALFMDLTSPSIAATQFSTYMGGVNLCESWSSWTMGRLIAANGYPAAMLGMCGASLVVLPIIGLMRLTGSGGTAKGDSRD